jgi:hypothetical protein
MKKIIYITLLLLSYSLLAQNTPRYYPSLKNLYSESFDKQMPNDFNYYDTWIKNLTQAVFYKDLQQSANPRGDASFMSMGLIFKRLNQFKIGNSGLEIVVNKDKPDFTTPFNIQMEQKFRILAYFRSFDPNKYNPNDFKQKYELGLMIFNLSEEQVLADFINRYISDKSNKKTTAIQQLVNDLRKEAKVKITVDENKDRGLLTDIVKQVYQQTNKYCSSVLYDIYIKTKDSKKEYHNFLSFFRSHTSYNASDYIDEVVSYEATLAIPRSEISLLIPKEILEEVTVDDSSKIETKTENNIEVRPTRIAMQTINTTNEKCVRFTLTLAPPNNPNSFKALNEIVLNKHPFLENNQRALNNFKVNNIKELTISMYANEIKVEIIVKDDNYVRSIIIMNQNCIWQ